MVPVMELEIAGMARLRARHVIEGGRTLKVGGLFVLLRLHVRHDCVKRKRLADACDSI